MIELRSGKKVLDTLKDKDLENDILEFVNTKTIIDEHNKFLKTLKEKIVGKARAILASRDEASITLALDDIAVKVSFAWDNKIVKEDDLKLVLGDRFADLVITKVSYAPTDRLKELSLDDELISSCIQIKEKAPAVSVVKG